MPFSIDHHSFLQNTIIARSLFSCLSSREAIYSHVHIQFVQNMQEYMNISKALLDQASGSSSPATCLNGHAGSLEGKQQITIPQESLNDKSQFEITFRCVFHFNLLLRLYSLDRKGTRIV